MGKAIENYLGQFGNYFPGSLSWTAASSDGTPELGYDQYIVDVQQQQRQYLYRKSYIATSVWDNYHMDFRCLGMGMLPPGASAPVGAAYDGDLKMAPVGLGLLMYTNVLPDARVFYCPSGIPSTGRDALGESCRWYYMSQGWPMDALRDWLDAGGTGADVLTHGNWQRWYRYNDNATFGYTSAILSQYAYRNQPIVAPWNGSSNCTTPFTVAYTKPRVMTNENCPVFKTPKLLRDRALVSDSFAKGFGYRAVNGTFNSLTTQPGFGDYCHQDGYNVLFGNYGTKWYSDVEKRLIYWDLDDSSKAYYVDGLWASAQYSPRGTYCTTGYRRDDGLPLAWHTLDVWNGVDIGATYDE